MPRGSIDSRGLKGGRPNDKERGLEQAQRIDFGAKAERYEKWIEPSGLEETKNIIAEVRIKKDPGGKTETVEYYDKNRKLVDKKQRKRKIPWDSLQVIYGRFSTDYVGWRADGSGAFKTTPLAPYKGGKEDKSLKTVPGTYLHIKWDKDGNTFESYRRWEKDEKTGKWQMRIVRNQPISGAKYTEYLINVGL